MLLIFTVGFPNTLVQGVAPKYTSGRVSALTGEKDDADYYQTSVPVLPGNSGGALVDAETGFMLGVVTARLVGDGNGVRTDNVSYALKSSIALNFLRSVAEAAGVAERRSKLPSGRQEIIAYAEKASVLVLVGPR